MLIDANEHLRGFARFLSDKGVTGVVCEYTIIPGHPAVSNDNGGVGFGAYCAGIILLADLWEVVDIPVGERLTQQMHCLAHEYAHHVQRFTDRPYDEDEANRMANGWVAEYGEAVAG